MSRNSRRLTMGLIAMAAVSLGVSRSAMAEERTFAVMLAHSPKSFLDANGNPGLPIGDLTDVDLIAAQYFERDPFDNIDSFLEYWEEISYGDVSVRGRAFGWVTVPWPFAPNGPGMATALPRSSPDNFINLHTGTTISENSPVAIPEPFAYGAGEDFCDAFGSLDTSTGIRAEDCGTLIITDTNGGIPSGARAAGMIDTPVVPINVWTPGERFLDIDGDTRWDALDELNDQMCHGSSGCRNICTPSVCSITGGACDTSPGTSAFNPCPTETCSSGTCTLTGGPCVIPADCPQQVCVVATGVCTVGGGSFTACRSDDDCTAPETCSDGGLCGTSCTSNSNCAFPELCGPGGVCRGTGVVGVACDRNEHCGAGEFCVGTCGTTGMLCENREDCPNPREVCRAERGTEQSCNNSSVLIQLTPPPFPIFFSTPIVACTVAGETCGDPVGSGPRGCNGCGCGDLFCPVNWDSRGAFDNPSDCSRPLLVPCSSNGQCATLAAALGLDPSHPGVCSLLPGLTSGFCTLANSPTFRGDAPVNCVPDVPDLNNLMPDCCDSINQSGEDFATCTTATQANPFPVDIALFPRAEGIVCGDPDPLCCEFFDLDVDDGVDVVEQFEDFMIRWEPAGRTPGSVWVRVDEKYMRDNYPGDVEKLIPRTGNGYYDSPDLFHNRGSTKMMQDAGPNEFAWRVPKPGMRKALPASVLGQGSAFLDEESWFDQWWRDWYSAASPGPTWPGSRCSVSNIACHGSGDCPGTETCNPPADPALNSPRIRPFDPADPVPPAVNPTTGPSNRWFHPDRGGCGGFGDGVAPDNRTPCFNFDITLGTDARPFLVFPEDVFGYYDGWVEHDDVPSSKYHRQGDKRFGEVTSPGTDTVTLTDVTGNPVTYTAVFGADLGNHNSSSPIADPDGFNAAAGPYATRIHGEKGFDAGDVAIIEWLTWRTDGTSPTVGYQWQRDNGEYHPFALPHNRCNVSTFLPCGPEYPPCPLGQTCTGGSLEVGFRDYNLDGMIDQGEVRPELSENYSVDSNPDTENNGTDTDYPFNRQRLLEDVIEALDPSVDWDEFIDVNSMDSHLCANAMSASSLSPNTVTRIDTTTGDTKQITAEGFVSGIVLVPPNAYNDPNLFPRSPLFLPVHNEDNKVGEDPNAADFMVPDFAANPFNATSVHLSFNAFFHDLVVCQNCRAPGPAVTPYAAHEYGHAWEGFPDLYDFDVFGGGVDGENCPVGDWDIMGFPRGAAQLVHPVPVLKQQACSAWMEPVDLTTVVTPGVETTITLPPAEFVRDESYFFLENEARPGERYYFWSAGSGFDERLPSAGMIVMHSDLGTDCTTDADCPPAADCINGSCVGSGSNQEGLPLQQRTPPWAYLIVQADGENDLEACSSDGNRGDAGDVWPGSTGATTFNFNTNPPATWNGVNTWTGLDISNVEPDGNGSVRLTLTWVPTNIPSLRFIAPPTGESVNSIFQVRFEATDVFGGTMIDLFFTEDKKFCNGAPGGTSCSDDGDCDAAEFCRHNTTIGSAGVTPITTTPGIRKITAGTTDLSFDWDLAAGSGVPDGRHVLFARLTPGPGADGTENNSTTPRAAPGNIGDGSLVVDSAFVDAAIVAGDTRSETWIARCIDPLGEVWLVSSSLSQPPPLAGTEPDASSFSCPSPGDPFIACTGRPYTSKNGEVRFRINPTSTDLADQFAPGDTFTFTTTGVTAVSKAVTVIDERITLGPTAVICATPLSGPPPLDVSFRAEGDPETGCNGQSSDPNGEPLTFRWSFGDGTEDAIGSAVSHAFTDAGVFSVRLTATNLISGRFDETTVDINVANNSPTASFTATPVSGAAPLSVRFNAANSSDTETPAAELIYRWNFGDGSTGNDQGLVGAQIVTTHVYTSLDGILCNAQNPCTFFASLTVTDALGKSDTSETLKILVGNSNPVANVTFTSVEGPAPLTVEFNAINSSDPDDDADDLTVDWVWGDGSSDLGVPLKGNIDDSGLIRHTYVNPKDDCGPDTDCPFRPTATIKDGRGGEAVWSGVAILVSANRGPEALCTVSPSVGIAGVTSFVFNASGSSDPEREQLTFTWDFDDGTPNGTDSLESHKFGALGEFDVVLTVTDSRGLIAIDVCSVSVAQNPGNQSPLALIATGLRICAAACTLRFDGSLSIDPEGTELTHSWRFELDDLVCQSDQACPIGFICESSTCTARASGVQVGIQFQTPGTYFVVLTVTDEDGASDEVGPQEIRILQPGTIIIPDPPPGSPLNGGDEPPNSALQRPRGLCGFGVVTSFVGTLFGLTAMSISRRRSRRRLVSTSR